MLSDVLAGLDPPIVHQRRFAATLDDLIDGGSSPVLDTAAGPLPVLEVARMEVVLFAARVALWQDLLVAAPEAVAGLDLAPSPELMAARRLVGDAGPAWLVAATTRAARSRLFRLRQTGCRLRAEGARPAPSSAGEAPVLVVPWRAVHLARWRPVLDRLAEEDGWRPLVVASDPRVLAAADDAGMAAQRVTWGLAAPAVAVTWIRLQRLAGRIGGALGAALRAVPGPTVAPARAVADAVAGARGARLLVVANPYIAEGRAAALAAQATGLPVVSAQHGTIFPDDPRWTRLPVDRMCVWGPDAQAALVGAGVAESRLAVTGRVTPRSPAPVEAGTTGRRPTPTGTVLVATSGPGDRVSLAQHLVFLDELGAAVRRTGDLAWVVKLHVKDDPQLYGPLAQAGVEVVPAGPATPPIETFLRDAAVLVTVASATALDAARAGVPVILVAVPGGDDHEVLAAMTDDGPAVARDGRELAGLVAEPLARVPGTAPRGLEPAIGPEAACRAAAAVLRQAAR